MQILRAETIPLELPLRERYVTAAGHLDTRSVLLFRVVASDGQIGWGEGVPLTMRGGAMPGQVGRQLSELCSHALIGADISPMLEGDPAKLRELISILLARCYQQQVSAPALAAVDLALHDLAGKLCGLPVWRILGAERPISLSCNASIDAAEPERAAELARAWADAGFDSFKIKVGTGDDLGRVAAVREAIGPDAKLRVDANRAWEVPSAIEQIAAMEPYSLELVEQPCGSLAELVGVRAATKVPVVADESVASVEDANEARRLRACDAATLKLSKVGGSLAALRISAFLPAYLSSSIDGPIGIAAAIHTHQAMPRGGWVGTLASGLATLSMFEATYARCEHLFGAELDPPRAPGLGVEVDEGAIVALRS
ncbi:MAG: mandelate racemase/muconate lactonizing enzyme family protein [Solirubrobacterales bacterium]